MKVMIFILVWLNFAAANASSGPVQTLRTWGELQSVVERNQVKTIDQLLEHLPVDFKKGYTLIYRPRALDRHLVSMKRPRVLMYGTDASFVMTYNSHVEGRAARPGEVESIETIEFRGDRAYLRELTFDGNSVPDFSQVEVNPNRCTSCHGSDPKGLWDPYNHWPGVYGSLSRGGVDFIRKSQSGHPIPEYEGWLSFLEEKNTNPRYQGLHLETELLRDYSARMASRGTPLFRPFLPGRMHDAVTFKDGHTHYTNQRLGFLLASHNFRRVGRMIGNLSREKKRAFQYIAKGISLDEDFRHLRRDKHFRCFPKIDQFFPRRSLGRSFTRFSEFYRFAVEEQQREYTHSKLEVEENNLGLSIAGAGFDPTDPFDQDRVRRDLIYDSVSPALNFVTYFEHEKGTPMTGSTVVPYFLHLLGIPVEHLTTASNGTKYSLYFGNSQICHNERGVLQPGCFIEEIEAFVRLYVPDTFYLDPEINDLTCDQLAQRSRKALKRYLRVAKK